MVLVLWCSYCSEDTTTRKGPKDLRIMSVDFKGREVSENSNMTFIFTRARVARGNGATALSKHDASYYEI